MLPYLCQNLPQAHLVADRFLRHIYLKGYSLQSASHSWRRVMESPHSDNADLNARFLILQRLLMYEGYRLETANEEEKVNANMLCLEEILLWQGQPCL